MSWLLLDRGLLFQSVLYSMIVIAGIISSLSSNNAKKVHNGLCILYGRAYCDTANTSSSRTYPSPASTIGSSSSWTLQPHPSTISSPKPNALNDSLIIPLTASTIDLIMPSTFSLFNTVAINNNHGDIGDVAVGRTIKPIDGNDQENIRYIIGESNLVILGGDFPICTFVTASVLMVCVLYGLVSLGHHAYCTHKSRFQIRVANQMWNKMLLFGSSLSCFLLLVSSCFLTAGLSGWKHSLDKLATASCIAMNGTKKPDEWNVLEDYNAFVTAEVFNWLSVSFWLIQIFIYAHRIMKLKHSQLTYQEPFTDDFVDAFT